MISLRILIAIIGAFVFSATLHTLEQKHAAKVQLAEASR